MKSEFLEELNQLMGEPSKIKTVSSVNTFNKLSTCNNNDISPGEIDLSYHSTEVTFSDPSSYQCSPFKHTIDVDPQQCEQYTDQIFKYLLTNERKNLPNPQYMKHQQEIKEKMREFLVDWIIELSQKFKFQNETLYLAVNIIDRYLSVQQVSKKRFQLIGIAALMIASKYEEIYPPEMKDFLKATRNNYILMDLVKGEREILNKLQFKVTVPYSYTFLQKFQQIVKVEAKNQHLMEYYLELTLLDYRMLKYHPSIVASSVFYLAQLNLNALQTWPLAIQQITSYDESDLISCVSELQELTQRIEKTSYIIKKFSTVEMNQVAILETQFRNKKEGAEDTNSFINQFKKSYSLMPNSANFF